MVPSLRVEAQGLGSGEYVPISGCRTEVQTGVDYLVVDGDAEVARAGLVGPATGKPGHGAA